MLLTQQYFNTVITVISYQKSQEDFDEMMDYIDSEFNRLNRLYDIYYDYPGVNNIKTINDNAGIAPVKVDKDIIDMLKFAKECPNIPREILEKQYRRSIFSIFA